MLFDDADAGVAHLLEPGGELREVGQRRRQADDLDVGGEVDEHLLPGRAPLLVVEEVDLVDDDRGEVGQLLLGQQDVAEDLGGHHPAGGVPADDEVAGDQADLLLSQQGAVVAELLVGQRLDGGGVDDLPAFSEGLLDDPVCDDGLSGAGGRADQGAVARLQRLDGLLLEPVKGKPAILHLCASFDRCSPIAASPGGQVQSARYGVGRMWREGQAAGGDLEHASTVQLGRGSHRPDAGGAHRAGAGARHGDDVGQAGGAVARRR